MINLIEKWRRLLEGLAKTNALAIWAVVVLCSAGCLSATIKEERNESDGSTITKMESINVPQQNINKDILITLDLVRNSTMPAGQLYMRVHARGRAEILDENSLVIVIDGRGFAHSPVDIVRRQAGEAAGVAPDVFVWKDRIFIITKEIMEQMLNAKEVLILIVRKDEITEGFFSSANNSPRNAFREYYDHVFLNKKKPKPSYSSDAL